MKARDILAGLLLLVAGVQTARAQKMTVNLTNGKTVVYTISQVESVTFDEGTTSNYEYVDLGLPSGTLWATCNIGAESPEEYGDYFAWGETQPKENYSSNSYKFGVLNNEGSVMMTKYCASSEFGLNGFTDGLTELMPGDDAATAIWGDEWQMPSKAQFEELISERYTTITWQDERPRGALITSKLNGNSIFLPVSGFYLDGEREGYSSSSATGPSCCYWARTLKNNESKEAYTLFLNSSYSFIWYNLRYCGQPVRPVRKGDSQAKLVTRIDLNATQLILLPDNRFTIYANVYPIDAANTNLIWESSNTSVAVARPADGATSGPDTSGASAGNSAVVYAVSPGTCTITCRATDGSGVYAECQVTVLDGMPSEEYVDLGLPSGTLWATCNVGAYNPEDYGDYYAWADPFHPLNGYTWENYWWIKPGGTDWMDISGYTFADGQTSGCWYSDGTFIGDGRTEVQPNDDAATNSWGDDWQTPSIAQFSELINSEYTTATWTTLNGVKGKKITSKRNGNSIFLPAAGYWDGLTLYDDGTFGHYWSRELTPNFSDYGNYLYFGENDLNANYGGGRYCGRSIRPVKKK